MIVALALSAIALAATPPQTDTEVAFTIAKEAEKRRWSDRTHQKKLDRALWAFANDSRPALTERLDAAKQLVQLRRSHRNLERKRGDALLLKARYEGILNLEKRRKRTLRQAVDDAKKHRRKKTAKRIEQMLEDDALYLRFARRRKRAIKDGEEADAKSLEQSLRRYRRLKERERALKVALTLADRRALAPAQTPAQKADLYRLTQWAPKSADAAELRQKARQERARWLEQAGEKREAVVERLRADREDPRGPKDAAFAPKGEAAPVRSRETSALCYALGAQGFDCAAFEKKTFGARSFYRFDDVKPAAFSPETAAWVFAEYQSLVHGCLKGAGQRREVAGDVEVEWSVANTGRVSNVGIRPRRLRQRPLHKCLKEAFGQMRYPAYIGEMQHIALAFHVAG